MSLLHFKLLTVSHEVVSSRLIVSPIVNLIKFIWVWYLVKYIEVKIFLFRLTYGIIFLHLFSSFLVREILNLIVFLFFVSHFLSFSFAFSAHFQHFDCQIYGILIFYGLLPLDYKLDELVS